MPSSSRGTASSGDRDQPLRESGSAGTSSESDVDTPTNVSSSAAHSPGSLSSSSLLQASTSAAAPPRLTRAFSMPLPSQLGLLQNPHSAALATTPPPPLSEPHSALHSFSIELAEAFQMVIQTLVQVSPPHLLDPAKEQLAACFLSLPTTSMSSLLISMKNLNYLAANTLPLTAQDFKFSPHINDFDIGEMLQGVGDAVSGVAANTGVDLVLYHGDVGMKHAYVRGDECGISCTLSHVVRQIIAVSESGDTVEIGLFVSSRDTTGEAGPSNELQELRADLWAHFDITQRTSERANGADPALKSAPSAYRAKPNFQSTILRGLMSHVQCELSELQADSGQTAEIRYRLTLPLAPPEQNIEDTRQHLLEQESVRQPFPNLRLASEPSLADLRQFAETLRGKKAAFYASASRSFAHRLTSYLTAWGMDVSHISLDKDGASSPSTESAENREDWHNSSNIGKHSMTPQTSEESSLETLNSDSSDPDIPSFVIIDDDVVVLRRQISQLQMQHRARGAHNLNKRPALIHRPKSSPHLRTFVSSPARPHTGPNVSIIHFTSISKYKLVRDLIQSISESHHHSGSWTPEIIAIPKPAGPRRFLTALYTAVNRPLIDPLFSPIATSPSSPANGEAIHSPLSLRHVNSKFSNGATESKRGDRAPRSPREVGGSSYLNATSPLAMEIEASEYFPDTVQRLGSSPASGVLIQSPDGQRAGIYFQPKSRPPCQTPGSRTLTRDAQPPQDVCLTPGQQPAHGTPARGKQPSARISETKLDDQDSKPSPADDKAAGSQVQRRAIKSPKRTSSSEVFNRSGKPMAQAPKKPKTNESPVVPPINVLIVEDNPINQTILSTFMKRKRIKFDTAADGVQAIEKYQQGNFHLILMDIQMPNMDGIEATKRIREIEANAGKSSQELPPGSISPSSSIIPPSSAIIVALTASSLATDRVNALAAGCNDFLTKPVSLLWLNNKIIEWGSLKVLQMWATAGPRNQLPSQRHRQRDQEDLQEPSASPSGLLSPAPTIGASGAMVYRRGI